MRIPRHEDVVRAICSDKWDGQRLAPSLFKGQNISVSRLAVAPLIDHWDLFRRFVEKPPERTLKRMGQINVGKLCNLTFIHCRVSAGPKRKEIMTRETIDRIMEKQKSDESK